MGYSILLGLSHVIKILFDVLMLIYVMSSEFLD